MIKDTITIFNAAVTSVQPATLMKKQVQRENDAVIIAGRRFPLSPGRPVWIFGAGKASAAMALALEESLHGLLLQGLVITKHAHTLPLQHIAQRTAGHPLPDLEGVVATQEMISLFSGIQPDDLVLFLLSGGASALLIDYPAGSDLAQVQQVFDLLLKSGADIHEMNTVRKHLSGVKGGQLALLANTPALCTLVLSDVAGDDLHVIGSGPTVPDPSTFADAMAVLEKYQLMQQLPLPLFRHLQSGIAGSIPETPKLGHPRFVNTYTFLLGTNQLALDAAAAQATSLGYDTHILTATAGGDAVTLARQLADKAIHWEGKRPACLLTGGETTVKVTANGLGGRNQHLALAAGIILQGHPGITLLSGGTDGTDGPTDAAGAIASDEIMQRVPNAAGYLERQDAWHYFEQAGSLLITGPTLTNVMDIIVVLIR